MRRASVMSDEKKDDSPAVISFTTEEQAVSRRRPISSIPGLSVLTSVISPEKEARLRRVIHEHSQEWFFQRPYRYLKQFGKGRTYGGWKRTSFDPIPQELVKFGQNVRDRFKTEAGCSNSVLVNWYKKNGSLPKHVDSVKQFGTEICVLNLGPETQIQFEPTLEYAKEHPEVGKLIKVCIPSRAAYVMSGKARYQFTHEVLKSNDFTETEDILDTASRVSVVYRSNIVSL